MTLICERLALCPGNNHWHSARTKTLLYTLNWPQSRRVRLQVQFSCLMLYGSGSNHLLRPVDSTNECLFSLISSQPHTNRYACGRRFIPNCKINWLYITSLPRTIQSNNNFAHTRKAPLCTLRIIVAYRTDLSPPSSPILTQLRIALVSTGIIQWEWNRK